jgi:hypothetical protein
MTAAVHAQQSGVVAVGLFTFSHPDLPQPILVCTAPVLRLSLEPLFYGIRSRGKDYKFIPIVPILPGEVEGEAPRARLSLDDVAGRDDSGAIVRASDMVRASPIGSTVLIEVVRADAPDLVETFFPELEMVRAPITNGFITIELSAQNLEKEPYPADRITPGVAPTLFEA